MAEPITWLAIEAIRDRLTDIVVADGFHTDIGLGDFVLDRSQAPEGDAAYTVIIAGEIGSNEEKSSNKTLASDMDITIEFSVPVGAGTISPELLAHRGRADIIKALQRPMRGEALGFRNFTITGSRISNAPEAGSSVVIAQVSARAGLSESVPPAT